MLSDEELDRLAKLGVELKQLEEVGADECDLGEQRRVAALQRFKGKLLQYGERLIAQAREANALRAEAERLKAEVEEADAMTEACEKRAGLPRCACMADRPDAVCMVHSPAVAECDARIHALEACLRELLSCVHARGGRSGGGDPNPVYFAVDAGPYSKAAVDARALLAPRESGEGEKADG